MPATASKPNSALKLIILSGVIVTTLSACGVRGNLKTPPPVFGEGRDAPLPDAVDEVGQDNDSSDLPRIEPIE